MAAASAGGNCMPGGGQFQRVPASPRCRRPIWYRSRGFRRDLPAARPFEIDQRASPRGVAKQPGDLLDRQQLVDHGVLMVDGGGKRARELVQRVEQSPAWSPCIPSSASAGATPSAWPSRPRIPSAASVSSLKRRVELRHQRRLLRRSRCSAAARARGPWPASRRREARADISRSRCPSARSRSAAGCVVERSVRRLCIALNTSAEASAISAMRLASCRRSQESQALSENPITTQNDGDRG